MARKTISIGPASGLVTLAVPACGQIVAYRNCLGKPVYTNLDARNGVRSGKPTGSRRVSHPSAAAASRFTPPSGADGYVRPVLKAYFKTKPPEAAETASVIYAARNRRSQVVYTNP